MTLGAKGPNCPRVRSWEEVVHCCWVELAPQVLQRGQGVCLTCRSEVEEAWVDDDVGDRPHSLTVEGVLRCWNGACSVVGHPQDHLGDVGGVACPFQGVQRQHYWEYPEICIKHKSEGDNCMKYSRQDHFRI